MFTSRELFMMNAGDKRYILTDGFAAIYQATPAEEEAWREELIAVKIEVLRTTSDAYVVLSAASTLFFHHYQKTTELLSDIAKTSVAAKQVTLAIALWKNGNKAESSELIQSVVRSGSVTHRHELSVAIEKLADAEMRNQWNEILHGIEFK